MAPVFPLRTLPSLPPTRPHFLKAELIPTPSSVHSHCDVSCAAAHVGLSSLGVTTIGFHTLSTAVPRLCLGEFIFMFLKTSLEFYWILPSHSVQHSLDELDTRILP